MTISLYTINKKVTLALFPNNLFKYIGFLTEAYSFFVQVEFGRYVLNEDLSVREMNDVDKMAISIAADRHSTNK